jgi:hypothetical protein
MTLRRLARWCLVARVGVVALGLGIGRGWAQEDWPAFSTDPALQEECWQQLRRIHEALQGYRQKNDGRLPAWLSDLYPQHLANRNLRVCPFVRQMGQVDEWRKGLREEVFRDPGTTYSYEFCDVELEDLKRVYGLSITLREYKERQRKLLGDVVPIARCIAHRPVLNLAYSGKIYTSDKHWEDAFAHQVNHVDLMAVIVFADKVREKLRRGPFPDRDPLASGRLLDLSAHYVAPLSARWLPDTYSLDNSLRTLPTGVQRLAGVDWDLRGLIQLAGSPTVRLFPDKVVGIRLAQKARALHFLHATIFSVAPDTPIARYVVHYGDDTTAKIPLVYGQDLAEWWGTVGSRDAPAPRIAWEGSNAAAASEGHVLRLYHSRWENPWPDLELARIDFISELSGSAPFLIAITLE